MLYPPLEEGHEVLGKEYCTGYTDIHEKWNTGFYCPPIIPDVPVFCCGTVVLKYCCTLGKPIPGGHYTKGYDSRHSDHEEEEELDHDNPENIPEHIVPDIPIVSSDEGDYFAQNSLLIGIICGLVAIAALLTIVSCFYCSCCILYKKRRGRLLSGGGLLYGIPASSSSTTTCGLLSSFGTGTPANVGIATSTCSSGAGGNSGGGRVPSSANHTSTATLPNFITTAAPINPLVDYWSSAGGSSNSSSCGVGTGGASSSTLIVAATATSLSPANVIGVHQPHHIHHGGVYHHHHHYTTASPIIGPGSGTLMMAPVQHLEPPPPYLAVAAVGEQGQCCDSMGTTGVIPTTRTPQRTNSRGSTEENSSQNSNLIRRQLSLLQSQNANNVRTTSPGNNNLGIPSSIDGVSHGNSPSISVVASSPPTSTTNTTTGARGSLPPPYFVEQYRIRNRVRPPRFLSNSGSSANSGSTSSHRSQRARAQETIHNLLYPLLNSATLSNSASSRHGLRARTSVDTQSEPRRNHFHHRSGNHNDNPCAGVGGVGSELHRSSSDRQQQNCASGGAPRSCYVARDSRGNGEGVVAINNIINNLSAGTRSSGRTCSGMRTARPITGSAGGIEETTTMRSGHGGHSGELDGRMIIDNLGKILNTEVQQQQRSQRQGGSRSRRSSRDQHLNAQNLPLSATPNSSSLPSHGSFSSHSNGNNQQQDFILMESALLTASQQRGDSSREAESHLVRTRLENELNENERTLTSQATNDNDNGGVMDEEEDDIIMMEDEEDEVIAVVTTTHHHNQDDHEEDEEEEVDIIDDLVMGFGGEEEEEYLVEDENSEENSTDKLSESAPNSSVSVSVDASHSHRNNEAKNENRKRGTGSPSSVLAGERGRDEAEDSDNHRRRKQQTRSNSESSSGNGNETRLPPAVNALDFVKTSEKPS